MLDPEVPALYPNAVIEVNPVLSPDFSALSVEVLVYFEKLDAEGNTYLHHAETRRIALSSGAMTTDEPTIAQVLNKLKLAVLKTLKMEFEPYNAGVGFEIV